MNGAGGTPWSLLISLLALFVSAFGFYWNSLRVKRAFYFLFVSNISHGFVPQFALVNAGNRDILITSIDFGFRGSDKSSSYFPAQDIHLDGGDSNLIAAGKALHGKIILIEPFTPEFAKTGDPSPLQGGFKFEVDLSIQWVDGGGQFEMRTVPYAECWLSQEGKINSFGPGTSQLAKELYSIVKYRGWRRKVNVGR